MPLNNKLIILDFHKGVRSSEVNFNFDVVKGWMERERLRVGGWGLVEGFDLTYPDNDFVVHVGEGIFINRQGEEVYVPPATLNCGAPPVEKITEEILVSDEGRIKLKYAPYSSSRYGLIIFNPPKDDESPLRDELSIVDRDMPTMRMPPLTVIGDTVTVSAPDFGGKTAKVSYEYSDGRIDAILLDRDGHYHLEQGINSTSPSKAHLDLSDMYLVGFAHWMVGRTISVEFIIEGRSYRPVYVNRQNVLYLNGKPYKEPKWIYFKQPESPEPNDVWYDQDSNSLMVWVEENGTYGWKVMNDFTNIPLRHVKLWIPDKNYPADGMTFLFDKDETDLRYIPGINALDIHIDQQTLMTDQYTEIIQPGAKPYLASGIGFKLSAPLDRPTIVQAMVHHVVRNGSLRNVFQRAAIFVYENYVVQSAANQNQVFQTELEYALQADQLEVFINGNRLNKNAEFIELLDDGVTPASTNDRARMSHWFKVTKSIDVGDKVTYKISRHVWSYDQLNALTEEIEHKADDALNRTQDNATRINILEANMTKSLDSMQAKVNALSTRVDKMVEYRRLDTPIALKDVADDIKQRLFANFQCYAFDASQPANDDNKIPNIKPTDFIEASYVSNGMCSALVMGQNADYVVAYDPADGGAHVLLKAELMSQGATVVINVIRFGV